MGRSLVLFSDGTGNSSAKLFKTNVWRMYEAVDLGPPAQGKRHQISYYDDGVGTSGFKPLAVLGGAFGWGLKRNILDIYRFACRNYQASDEIYGFGFSRGAFTMRVAIAFIASQGLVQSDNEAELLRRSRDAYHEFRRDFLPRLLVWPTKARRAIRNWSTRGMAKLRKRSASSPSANIHPIMRFVGVWDTVAAYGGPIVEVTRAIDNWVFPLSMPDYKLSAKVMCARHALALDDERDAFQPLLWDEVHESELIQAGRVPADRLEQVWFTGMHSDVGGGYPDESLSYVSLLWMMEEAEKAGLRTLQTIKDRFIALASGAGPMHDSRHGLAAYYRYQPRKIAAWTHPVSPETSSLRDPIIKTADGSSQGLLRTVRVHESVIARIASGTDRYAPITLPRTFEIVPPQVEGENVPQQDSENGESGRRQSGGTPHPLTSPALRARLVEPAVVDTRANALEAVWDFVWWRRVMYFVTVVLTLLLVTMPQWAKRAPMPPLLADGRTWVGGIIRLVSLFLPDFLESWVTTYADHAFYFLIIAGAIWLVMRFSSWCELTLRDRARSAWREATSVGGPPCATAAPTRLQKSRNNPRYQRSVQIFKWYVLPNVVFAPIIALLGVVLVGGLLTQISLSFIESGARLCASAGPSLPELTEARRIEFSTRATCHPVGARVIRGKDYTVTFEVIDEWRDADYATTPLGLAASDMGWGIGYLGVPFRRVIKANYLQPAIEIRQARNWLGLSAVNIYPLEVKGQGSTHVVYRADFRAARDGELLLFANDAVLPFGLRYFYEHSRRLGEVNRGNAGTACVTVQRVDIGATRLEAGTLDAGAPPVCREAARRAAARRTAATQTQETRAEQ